MGFEKDGLATVWSAESVSDTVTKLRISTSRKNRDGEYETDFSGFVTVYGTSPAARAAKLKERDRIKLGDVEVSTRYDKEKNITYTNYKMFSFEKADFKGNKPAPQQKQKFASIDDGEVDNDVEDNDKTLPF